MNKILILLLSATICLSQKNPKQIYEMTNHEIDSIITQKSEENLTITERMSYYSSLFLGMPYNLTCTGDGPYALYEPEPLVNFDSTNCMVYCEHVLALSISDSWDNFFNNLQQIRYKDGIIGMRTRNHYTMADWLPENDWLLRDAAIDVGGEYSETITRTISHKNFFSGKGITDMRYVKPDRAMTVNYIPFDALDKVKGNFENGDIIALLFKNLKNIFSAHMLMVYEEDNDLVIRESGMSKMNTFDTSFDEWVEKFLDSKKYIGIAIMRVKPELNSPGKVILPWEINELKK
jgi:hypothetical protein